MGFVAGLFVGAALGALLVALMHMARNQDRTER